MNNSIQLHQLVCSVEDQAVIHFRLEMGLRQKEVRKEVRK